MGAIYSVSCSSHGSILLVAAANGDLRAAQEQLQVYPRASLYHSFRDKSTPLIQAAARGQFEMMQLILETAVMVVGPEKAKRRCIDHPNQKKQTALMVACKHGHADCVEYLVTNGADPLLCDERRHNSCLHFAALYGHSECIHKLLGSRTAGDESQQGDVRVVLLSCRDEDGTSTVKFIDRHNGWGLTALQIAVFQGSVQAVRALLRHGADLESVITSSKVENSPIRFAEGSNALHIAALVGNIVMVKLLLEAQESHAGLELRSKVDALGLRPQEYALRARNPVLMHLLDERLPVNLLRQIWMNYSLDQSLPPRHQTLEALLQKLKLMFNLEIIAVQRKTAALSLIVSSGGAGEIACPKGGKPSSKASGPAAAKLQWDRRETEVQQLLVSVSSLSTQLQTLLTTGSAQDAACPRDGRSPTHEALLDFILSTVITPRTVSAILHAAKKLVSSSRMQETAVEANKCLDYPPKDPEAKHGLALLNTALKLVESCVHVASFLSTPAAMQNLEAPTDETSAPIDADITPQDGPAQDPDSIAARPAGQESGAAAEAGTPPGSVPIAAVSTNGSLNSLIALPVMESPQRFPVSDADRAAYLHAIQAGTPMRVTSSFSAPLAGSLLPRRRLAEGLAVQVAVPTAAALAMNAVALTSSRAAIPILDSPIFGGPTEQAVNLTGSRNMAVSPYTAVGAVPPHSTALGTLAGPYYSHWSSHLHTLISQLQRDISVQRHRRRRQHAAQATARAAAAANPTACLAGSEALPDSTRVSSVPPAAVCAFAPTAPEAGHPSNAAAEADGPSLLPRRKGSRDRQQAAARSAPDGTEGDSEGGTPRGTAASQQGDATPIQTGCSEILVGEATWDTAAPCTALPPPEGTVSSATCSNANKAGLCKKGGALALNQKLEALMTSTADEASEDEDKSEWSEEAQAVCSICMDMPVAVQVSGCKHGLCVQCAFQLTMKGRELPSCPFCRQKIELFEPM